MGTLNARKCSVCPRSRSRCSSAPQSLCQSSAPKRMRRPARMPSLTSASVKTLTRKPRMSSSGWTDKDGKVSLEEIKAYFRTEFYSDEDMKDSTEGADGKPPTAEEIQELVKNDATEFLN